MIKGCNKRVIVMKETGSDLIEEAIFIIRSDATSERTGMGDGDILRQAQMILDGGREKSYVRKAEPEAKRRRWKGSFACGIIVGALFTVAVFLVL